MQCPTGKVCQTRGTAQASSKRARRRTENAMGPYHCTECGQWHVGNRSGLKKPTKTIHNSHQI